MKNYGATVFSAFTLFYDMTCRLSGYSPSSKLYLVSKSFFKEYNNNATAVLTYSDITINIIHGYICYNK